MKRTLSFILIAVALTNIVGFMPLYFSLLQEIRSEVGLKLSSNSDLDQVRVSREDYQNHSVFSYSGENEFTYKGRMYDFKTVTKLDDAYIFSALEDNKESGLIDFMKAVYAPSNEKNKDTRGPFGNLMKSFSKDFVGCFSRPVLAPLSAVSTRYPSFVKYTSPGYSILVQHPPDLIG